MAFTFSDKGFFGYGEKGDFKYFSFAHFIPLILLGVTIFLLWKFRHKLRNSKFEGKFRFILAFIMIIVEMSYFWRLLYVGGDYTTKLPITICGWTAILSAFMLMSKNQSLFDICFFFTLTAGLQPLLTPAVIMTTGPAYYRYYQFWLEHTLTFVALFYMIFSYGYRPKWSSMLKAFGLFAVITSVALIANSTIPGANYLYLSQGAAGSSFLDFLPDNMWIKTAIVGSIIIALCFIAYSPYMIMDIVKKKRLQKANEEVKSTVIEEPKKQKKSSLNYSFLLLLH